MEQKNNVWMKLYEGFKKIILIIFFIMMSFVALVVLVGFIQARGTTNSEEKIINNKFNISVTSINTKLIDGKFRYFFDIRNNDDVGFIGDVNINLINAEGKSIYDKTFKDASIDAGIGKSVYIDINTGPVQVHGANGISSFEFTASKGEQVIKNGSGPITTQ